MSISVRASGLLKQYVAANLELSDVETVAEAMKRLRLPEEVGMMVLVNGHVASRQTPLQDGDELHLVPVVSGG
ncbi:MAG: MoaD/ThiS family protein [Chloroflexi bacterium]|nr:MoaD/ThiS family protein [Chloroflexota bacterium]